MLAQYQERLTAIHCKLTAKQQVASSPCNDLHGDLLRLLLVRLNGDGLSSDDEQLISCVKSFYNQQNFQARRCDLTTCQTSLQVHEMMHKKSNNINTRSSIIVSSGGALVPLSISSIGKRELTTVEEWISPELMVAHAAYTRAQKHRGHAIQYLTDYQELLRLLQEKGQMISSHNSSGNSLDVTYALRILKKMIMDMTWFVDACATNPEISGNDGSSHKNKRSRIGTT